jgi:Zn-dependent protease
VQNFTDGDCIRESIVNVGPTNGTFHSTIDLPAEWGAQCPIRSATDSITTGSIDVMSTLNDNAGDRNGSDHSAGDELRRDLSPAGAREDALPPAEVLLLRHPLAEEAAALLASPPPRSSRWAAASMILVFTLAAFYFVEAQRNTWFDVLSLIGVLLFHELGHFAGMRLFGYRDVRMFFIPFFGAAVSGRKVNIKAWQEAVILILGPLPGIAAGFVLSMALLAWDQPNVRQLALLLITINALNLFPLLPFDGGRLANLLWYGRSPAFEAAFQLMGAIVLMGLGYMIHFSFWMLGILLLVSVHYNFKLARLAFKVHPELHPLIDRSTDQAVVPQAACLPLVEAVLVEFSTPASKGAPKVVATIARTLWERLHHESLSLGAAVGFFCLYLAAMQITVISFVLLMLNRMAIR